MRRSRHKRIGSPLIVDPPRPEEFPHKQRGASPRGIGLAESATDCDEPGLRSSHGRRRASACPHDCPSTCALEVEVLDERTIGRVRGAPGQRLHGGRDLRQGRALRRARAPSRPADSSRCGARARRARASWQPISWDDALDLVAEKFLRAEQRHGAEAVWPYYYAGTMGLVMRDGINRLRHAKSYSGFFDTICINPAWSRLCRRHRAASPAPIRARWRSPTSS